MYLDSAKKKELFENWKDIKITQENNFDNIICEAVSV